MSQTELDHTIQDALQGLIGAPHRASTPDPSYIKAFSASARRKAEAVLGFISDGTFPVKQPVFVSVGGGDGEELAHLLENSNATEGVLLELSDRFADLARNRQLSGGKNLKVFVGSAQSRIADVIQHAAQLVRDGRGDAMIISCHAVIHEMYDRGGGTFDALGFFGPIFKYPDIATGFTYREPGDVSGWPDELLISADCDPESLLKLAEAIRSRHQALRTLTPHPQTIAGESLRVHRTLGLELLAKLFYLEDLSHEIEERSTSINHDHLNHAIQTAIGDGARFDNRAIAQTHAGPTLSFVDKWKRMKVRIEGRKDGGPKYALAVPEFQKRMVVWRDARRTTQPEARTLPSTPPPVADYDPKHRVFHLPYPSKGDRVVGRAEGLKKVRDQLTKGRRTVIGQTASFTGLGGLGKTQLAVEYAWEYEKEYPNGVIWIEADQDIDAQLTALAVKARWVAEASEHRYKLDVALKRLRSFSDCLIVFDNVEARESIEPYLPEAGVFPHILITSRDPQPGFERLGLEPLNEEQSLHLLIQEAGRSPASDDDAAAAREIARHLDGLPLAIEIGGAYLHEMPSTTFAEFWQLLARDPQIHAGREYLASFTRHEADLDAALRISDRAMQEHPRVNEVLDLLTWSGAATMGTSLMSAMLNLDPLDLLDPLAFGARLHLLKEERDLVALGGERRFRIHRLVREVRRAMGSLSTRSEWVELTCKRIGKWFRDRREEFEHLAIYEAEIDHLRVWQEHARSFSPQHVTELLWLEAYPAWHRGRYAQSKRLLDNAVREFEPAKGRSELQAHLMNDLSTVVSAMGEYRRSLDYQEKALSLQRELLGEKHPDTVRAYSNLGTIYVQLGERRRGLEYLAKTLALRREVLGEKHPETATSHANLGSAYAALGEHLRALECREKALSLRRELLGEKHPDTAQAYANLGNTYHARGEHLRGLEYQEKALALRRELLGEKHPATALSYGNLSVAYGAMGEDRRALAYAEKALSLRQELLGEKHPDTAMAYNNLGIAYGKRGDYQRALEYQKNAAHIFGEMLGNTHLSTVTCMLSLARLYAMLGRERDGFRLVRDKLRTLSDSHPCLGEARAANKWFLQQYPSLRELISGHPPKKPRNRKGK